MSSLLGFEVRLVSRRRNGLCSCDLHSGDQEAGLARDVQGIMARLKTMFAKVPEIYAVTARVTASGDPLADKFFKPQHETL